MQESRKSHVCVNLIFILNLFMSTLRRINFFLSLGWLLSPHNWQEYVPIIEINNCHLTYITRLFGQIPSTWAVLLMSATQWRICPGAMGNTFLWHATTTHRKTKIMRHFKDTCLLWGKNSKNLQLLVILACNYVAFYPHGYQWTSTHGNDPFDWVASILKL